MNGDRTTRERLLAAATGAFAERGYAGASVREICALGRANPGAVSYHFGGKRQLYRAVLRAAAEELLPLTAAHEAAGGPGARLAALAGGVAGGLERAPALARLVLRDLADGGEAVREALVPALRRAVQRAADAAGAEADPAGAADVRERAAALLAVALAFPLLWSLVREAAALADERRDAVLERALRALAAGS